ncbi:MAG: hypothetical protein COV66_10545 [Nitrospinae bacterium CG11_big_fil_rev_8_21_14_0_20_45_15]|nr:MAG: hypothetical protein COV66_10545 [Nitrospinae bacterium CG11_big_fil_rev_8_21_14_0_20_45_15]
MANQFFYPTLRFAFMGMVFWGMTLPTLSQAIPMGSPNDKNQARVTGDWMFHPSGEQVHPSHYPNSGVDGLNSFSESKNLAKSANNDLKINEPHPIPQFIESMSISDKFPALYLDILNTPPVDYLQSKIFDDDAFRKIKRIRVYDFENKTTEPFQSADAGQEVARKISEELKNISTYTIIHPAENKSDLKLQIFAPHNGTDTNNAQQNTSASPFAEDAQQADAVLIGAVTKYSDTYINEQGIREPSFASVLEFGAYLVQPKTGKVIWGARYVNKNGGASSGWVRFKNDLSKEEHSQLAIKTLRKALKPKSSP